MLDFFALSNQNTIQFLLSNSIIHLVYGIRQIRDSQAMRRSWKTRERDNGNARKVCLKAKVFSERFIILIASLA